MSSEVTRGGWPDATDVRGYMGVVGISPRNDVDLTIPIRRALNAAIQAFETRTRRTPFLSSGTDETRYFDVPNGTYLDLGDALGSFTSLTIAGTAYEPDQSFTLMPINAVQQQRPWSGIEFGRDHGQGWQDGFTPVLPLFVSGTGRKVIAVTGKWGWLTVPWDVSQAVIAEALANSLGLVTASTTGGATQVRNANGSSITFGASLHAGLKDELKAEFAQAIQAYRKVEFG